MNHFEVGDVLLKTSGLFAPRRYVVLGYSSRGNLRLLRETGTVRTVATWSPSHLPNGYVACRPITDLEPAA